MLSVFGDFFFRVADDELEQGLGRGLIDSRCDFDILFFFLVHREHDVQVICGKIIILVLICSFCRDIMEKNIV